LRTYAAPGNITVVARHGASVSPVYREDEQEVAAIEPQASGVATYSRAVQTVRFAPVENTAAATPRTGIMAKLAGFVAFPAAHSLEPPVEPAKPVVFHRKTGTPAIEEVDQYLWEVYQRAPVKKDHSGDFTWKDPAAAQKAGMTLHDYVVGGMDSDFREQLYHAGRAMDAAGIQWSILSGFRDDYRQSLASGFKARVGRSLHGGSRRTGGYGHGQAVDVTNADGDADVIWRWLDANGAKYGLHRPLPGVDPAHVQSRGDWRKLALTLREARMRAEAKTAAAATGNSNVVAKAW
jgi:hypothetical protein